MTEQRDALLRLLHDDDPATLLLLKGQLAARGPSAIPEFRALLTATDPVAARHLRDVIAEIEAREADAVFGKTCADFGPESDLENAAWQLAATFLPGENFAPQRALLDAWGAEVARRFRKAESDLDRIEMLVEYLGDEVGLCGNVADYNNLNNSLLPEVIDTRLGIPISLSLIYILVGKRAGIPISGAGLPGHFLIRHGQNFSTRFTAAIASGSRSAGPGSPRKRSRSCRHISSRFLRRSFSCACSPISTPSPRRAIRRSRRKWTAGLRC